MFDTICVMSCGDVLFDVVCDAVCDFVWVVCDGVSGE